MIRTQQEWIERGKPEVQQAIRCCSICGAELYYRLTPNIPHPGLDTNCDCVPYTSPIKDSDWESFERTFALPEEEPKTDN
jgi:hypothetical protein